MLGITSWLTTLTQYKNSVDSTFCAQLVCNLISSFKHKQVKLHVSGKSKIVSSCWHILNGACIKYKYKDLNCSILIILNLLLIRFHWALHYFLYLTVLQLKGIMVYFFRFFDYMSPKFSCSSRFWLLFLHTVNFKRTIYPLKNPFILEYILLKQIQHMIFFFTSSPLLDNNLFRQKWR